MQQWRRVRTLIAQLIFRDHWKVRAKSVKRLLVFKEKFVEEEGEVQEDKANIKLRNSCASDVSWAPSM
jgi:hypothetical protein